MSPTIQSPCINICKMDAASGLCLGCYRKLNEVAAWARLSEGERDAILAEMPERRSLIRPEKLAMF